MRAIREFFCAPWRASLTVTLIMVVILGTATDIQRVSLPAYVAGGALCGVFVSGIAIAVFVVSERVMGRRTRSLGLHFFSILCSMVAIVRWLTPEESKDLMTVGMVSVVVAYSLSMSLAIGLARNAKQFENAERLWC